MITRSRFKKAGAGWAAPALEAFQADDSVNNQMRLKTFRPAGVGQAVVAHSCGENFVQKADLLGTELVLTPGAVGQRLVYGLELALEHIAGDGPAGFQPLGGKHREGLGAFAPGAVVENTVPDAVAGGNDRAGVIEAGINRFGRLVFNNGLVGIGAHVVHPLVHDFQAHALDVELVEVIRRLVADANEPDGLVVGVAHVIDNALAHGKALHRVVHVEHRLQPVAEVEHRNVDLPVEHLPRFVQGGNGLEVAFVTRGRPVAVGQHDVAATPGVEVVGGGVTHKRIAFLHHVLGRLPAADGGVELEELFGVDLAFDKRLEAVLNANVVDRAAGKAVVVGAVDVAQVVHVGPLDFKNVGQRFPVFGMTGFAVVRVERQGRQAAPCGHAFGHAGGGAVAHGQLGFFERIAHFIGGVEAHQQAAVGGGVPERIVAVGHVHVVLKQLAVAHVNGLGHQVGIVPAGDGRVDEAGLVLAVYVLRDGTAGRVHAHGVFGQAKALDEVFLGHERSFAANLQFVVVAGARAAGIGNGVPQPQRGGFHGAAVGPAALGVAYAHPALKVIDQAAAPAAGVGIGAGRTDQVGIGQHGVAVEKAVDGAALDAHHKIDLVAVDGDGGGQIIGAAAVGGPVGPAAVGGAVVPGGE